MDRLQDELHSDEPEDDRKALAQVLKAAEQALEQEEQLPKAHERERVRSEDNVGLTRDSEHGRNAVEGEQQVGRADGEHDERHWGEHPLASDDGSELRPVVLGRRREATGDETDEAVSIRVGPVFVIRKPDLPCREEKEGPEDIEDS